MYITARVRSGTLKKCLALPFISVSGVFKRRAIEHVITYSGIVSIDLDDVNINLKTKLFEDPVLRPQLIFVSPSQTGLKLFIKVKNASAEYHNHYFNAISVYLINKYQLKPDSSCRDISRACFLCHDPHALYSELGSVDSDTLLEMIPPAPCMDEQMYITYNPLNYSSLKKFNLPVATTNRKGDANVFKNENAKGDAINCVSTVVAAYRDFHRKNCMFYFSDKLNGCPQVHAHAISILKQNGWQENDKYWTRPGKNPGKGHSAVFSYFEPYGIYLFTNFSNNAPAFSPNKSYSDCMVIAILAYNSDYNKCIGELMQLFGYLL